MDNFWKYPETEEERKNIEKIAEALGFPSTFFKDTPRMADKDMLPAITKEIQQGWAKFKEQLVSPNRNGVKLFPFTPSNIRSTHPATYGYGITLQNNVRVEKVKSIKPVKPVDHIVIAWQMFESVQSKQSKKEEAPKTLNPEEAVALMLQEHAKLIKRDNEEKLLEMLNVAISMKKLRGWWENSYYASVIDATNALADSYWRELASGLVELINTRLRALRTERG